jgi:agmatinase/guanidinopropionase
MIRNSRDPSATEYAPAYAGIPTFMRLPATHDLADVDVAVAGIPYDGGSSTFRTGSRMGPRAIRENSLLIEGYHPRYRFNPLDLLRVVDYGDLEVKVASIEENIELVAEQVSRIVESGATVISLGGDHSITFPLLKAHADRYGPLAVIHVDAHTDTEEGYYNHGTPFVDAIRAGAVDAEAYVQVGIRGAWDPEDPIAGAESLGAEIMMIDDCFEMGIPMVVRRIRQKVGTKRVYVSLDVDAADPAYAPGVSTPAVGGFTSYEILQMIRGLRGLRIAGYDVVEVNPQYDHGAITSVLGANIAYEFLCLAALSRTET